MITLLVYGTLGLATVAVLWRMSRRWRAEDEGGDGVVEPTTPYDLPDITPTPAPHPVQL